MEKLQTLEEIRAAYPNLWVLLADVVMDNTQVVAGRVVSANKDKQALAEPVQKIIQSGAAASVKSIFTGTLPSNPRKWQPSIILQETRKNL